MDVFDEELLNLWKSLNKHLVKYIMVGGVATNLNGYQRTTADIDIWIEDTLHNRESLRKAFRDCQMGDFYMLKTMQIIPGWTDFRLNNGLRVDLLVSMKGLEEFSFDESLSIANIAEIEGVRVPFLQMNQLIANKKAVNRPKDQLDIIYLERIQKIIEEEENQKKA
jgi:predicted nucleotidyltransferase